nr:hypothetical protein [uncultured bacterium]
MSGERHRKRLVEKFGSSETKQPTVHRVLPSGLIERHKV